MKENAQISKSFQSLSAEQQRNIARHKPQLMEIALCNMTYREWRQYKNKQRSDRKC